MNYKIKTENTKVPDERIRKHMNFEKVLSDYHQVTQQLYRKPLYKNPKLFMSLFLAATISGLVYLAVLEEQNTPSDSTGKQTIVENSSFITPFSENGPAWNTIEFTPGKTLDWAGPHGEKLSINGDAFCLEGNKTPEGKVEIKFRMLNDAADKLSAGIPFNWRSGASSSLIDSKAAFEIHAFNGGKEIKFCNDFAAQLSCPVKTVKEEKLDVFRLSTENNTWILTGDGGSVVKSDSKNTWDGFTIFEADRKPKGTALDTSAVAYECKFNFSQTGIWTAGSILKAETEIAIALTGEDHKVLSSTQVYRIAGENTWRMPLRENEGKYILEGKVNAGSDRVIALLADGKIATGIISEEGLKSRNIELKIVGQKTAGPEGIRSALGH